jgi:hypothetical protein
MSVTLKSKVQENTQNLKRKHDKVRQLFDQDNEEMIEEEEEEALEDDFELDTINLHP